ncbi:MAG: lipid-binding SYLF domain-containing protein [Geminicoccaceae bacterium]
MTRRSVVGAGLLVGAMVCGRTALASSAGVIDGKVRLALKGLYEHNAAARALGEKAVAVLVFPDIVKGGLVVGGQYGEGALVKGEKIEGHYRSVAASWGLQAGVQTFGYALFFMNEAALAYLERSNGWEVGVGPTLVVVDQGASASLTTTTAKDDIYAFFFDQKGLMAGIGIQGSKITRFTPDA